MKTSDKEILDRISDSVASRRADAAAELTSAAVDSGLPPRDVQRAILEGLNIVRRDLMSNRSSLPEFLLCIDASAAGLARLAETRRDKVGDPVTVVMGVVEGDPHELGKNIIAGVYRACGHRVVDLGTQVSSQRFVNAVLDNKAGILGLSAMMSTTMTGIPDIIKEVRLKSPGTVIMVGGASLDRKLAEKFGADGYAESAVTVIEETEAALSCSSRSKP